MRFFNTAGPCDPETHYMLPAEARLPEARVLGERRAYFVLHAPRQTGKTTTLRALARALTAEGRFAALCFSCEAGEATGDDYAAAQRAVLGDIRDRAADELPAELRPPTPWPAAEPERLLAVGLRAWAKCCPQPLVLFFDEIDALRGEGLRSVLRQLRAGYPDRPGAFPWSVVLCGLRDVRDYKAASGGDATRLGTASPFNIKVKSLRLGDFTAAELRALYAQHTADTGQSFTEEALSLGHELTAGQPWLVNALAREVVEEMRVPPPAPIAAEHIDRAKERLIVARQTHLDSLVARLHEERVQRVIEPLIGGGLLRTDSSYDDDLSYVRDLGLVASELPVRVANPIYREVIVRVLGSGVEGNILVEPRSFVLPDGRLDLGRLLEEFAAFWREHGEVLAAGVGYHEVAPQLVLMAFLHRVVNSGGYVDRECGVGRGRIDLCLRWPYLAAGGQRQWQREAVELKVWAPGKQDPLPRGIGQLDEYLDRLGLETGVLVVFDRRPEAGPIAERTRFERATSPKGRPVVLLRA
ncbi:MAG: ATP-binding protein [Deltaproteobacteria bacterium]|nr:ATP-binding protein [Deltaproteobacteria bacterium]